MKEGEQSKYIVPALLGWGSSGNEKQGVPPNTDLVYFIKLYEFDKVSFSISFLTGTKKPEKWDVHEDDERRKVTKNLKEQGNAMYSQKRYADSPLHVLESNGS